MDRAKLGKMIMAAGGVVVAAAIVSIVGGRVSGVTGQAASPVATVYRAAGSLEKGRKFLREDFVLSEASPAELAGKSVVPTDSFPEGFLEIPLMTGDILVSSAVSRSPAAKPGSRTVALKVQEDDPMAYRTGETVDVFAVFPGSNAATRVAKAAQVVSAVAGRGHVLVSVNVAAGEIASVAAAVAGGTVVLAKRLPGDETEVETKTVAKAVIAKKAERPKTVRMPSPKPFVAEVIQGRTSSSVVLHR